MCVHCTHIATYCMYLAALLHIMFYWYMVCTYHICSENVTDESDLHDKSLRTSLPIQTPAVNFSFVNDIVSCDHQLYQ